MSSRPTFLRLKLAALALLAAACSGVTPAPTVAPTPAPAATKPSPTQPGLSSVQLVKRMGLGWNLGNTMEAIKQDAAPGSPVRVYETAWGNPETTRELFTAIRVAGFSSVRIPVAWSNGIGPDFTIKPELLDRVQWIVDMAQAEGLIAVVNIHWDGGWWSKFPTDFDGSMKRYTRLWSQISTRFRDYPETLVFESLNEEACFNDVWDRYGAPAPDKKQKAYDIANKINQSFVDLIRRSGGRNGQRHLLIAGYATDIDLTTDAHYLLPKDPAGRLIVSMHYYTPFTFAGLTKDESWGKMRNTWGTPQDLAELDGKLKMVKDRFLDQGVPVIIGEYGSEKLNKEPASVRLYLLTVAEKMLGLGMCPMLWDPGTHFDRQTLQFKDKELGDGFKKILEAKP